MAASFSLGTLLPPLDEAASSLAHSCLAPLVPDCLTLAGGSPERTEPCPIPTGLSLQALLKKGLRLYARSEIQSFLFVAGNPSLQPGTGHLGVLQAAMRKSCLPQILPGVPSGFALRDSALRSYHQEVTPVLLGALFQTPPLRGRSGRKCHRGLPAPHMEVVHDNKFVS